MSSTRAGAQFSYWFDVAIKGIITVMLVVAGFMGERMVDKADEAQKEINALNVKVATLETKLDFIIRNMEYDQPKNIASK